MDNNFLLTYNYENSEGIYDSDYAWFESEDEMREEIDFLKEKHKKFKVNEMFEIINAREVEF